MIRRVQLRRLFEERKPLGFVRAVYNLLGLADEQGYRYRDSFGRPEIRNPQIRPEEIRTDCLGQAIFGDRLEESFDGDNLARFSRYTQLMESQGTPLLEAGGVDVTQFLNINTYNATVGGLIEFAVLEGFQMPGYAISEAFFASKGTKLNGQRMGRIGSIGDRAKRRMPGMPTERVGLTEEWIDTPETEEYALSIEVNQEAPFFDLTGDILPKANSIGEAVRYRKELRCIDVFAGITNPYSYKSTAINTYLETDPAAAERWYNSFVNPLVDQDDVNEALQLFARITDPASGKRVIIVPDTIVTVPSLEMRVAQVLGATSTRQQTQVANNVAAETRYTINWISGKVSTVITSPLLHMRLTDADGANLSEDNSKRWWYGQKAGTFAYMENWPLRVDQANPSTMEMVDRGIIAFYKASERGVPVVQEPRKIVRNKVA